MLPRRVWPGGTLNAAAVRASSSTPREVPKRYRSRWNVRAPGPESGNTLRPLPDIVSEAIEERGGGPSRSKVPTCSGRTESIRKRPGFTLNAQWLVNFREALLPAFMLPTRPVVREVLTICICFARVDRTRPFLERRERISRALFSRESRSSCLGRSIQNSPNVHKWDGRRSCCHGQLSALDLQDVRQGSVEVTVVKGGCRGVADA